MKKCYFNTWVYKAKLAHEIKFEVLSPGAAASQSQVLTEPPRVPRGQRPHGSHPFTSQPRTGGGVPGRHPGEAARSDRPGARGASAVSPSSFHPAGAELLKQSSFPPLRRRRLSACPLQGHLGATGCGGREGEGRRDVREVNCKLSPASPKPQVTFSATCNGQAHAEARANCRGEGAPRQSTQKTAGLRAKGRGDTPDHHRALSARRPPPRVPAPRPHLGIAETNEQQRQQVAENEGAHHVGLLVALVGPLLPAEGLVADVPVEEALVVCHRRGHGDGQRPDEAQAQQRVAGHPQGGGAPRVHDGHVAVHRHRGQSEDADQHGDGEEVVDELADEGAQHPGGQCVHRGLEGDAEEQVGQVGDAQVEDEQVGGAAWLAGLAARQHGDHQTVAQHAECEDQAEHHQRDEVLDADAEERPRLCGGGLGLARVPLAEVPGR